MGGRQGVKVRVLLDSGAAVSFVSMSVCEKLGVQGDVCKSSEQFVAGDGHGVRSVGFVSIPLLLLGVRWVMSFRVCTGLICDVVLGRDFMGMAGVRLVWDGMADGNRVIGTSDDEIAVLEEGVSGVSDGKSNGVGGAKDFPYASGEKWEKVWTDLPDRVKQIV